MSILNDVTGTLLYHEIRETLNAVPDEILANEEHFATGKFSKSFLVHRDGYYLISKDESIFSMINTANVCLFGELKKK